MAEMTVGADPGDHNVDEVLAHLAGADKAEAERVFAAEAAGKARVGILDQAPFDPSDHNIDDVNAHLDKSDDDERARVLQLEVDGKARKGILARNTEPEADPIPHSSFVDAAHDVGDSIRGLLAGLQEDLQDVLAQHTAVIAEHAPDPGEEPVWAAHNRVGFALSDLQRPLDTLTACVADLQSETSSRGAVSPEPEDDDA